MGTGVMGTGVMGTGVLALTAAPILDLTGAVSLLPVAGHDAVRIGGLVLAAASVVTVLAAQLAMGASWRTGVDPHEHARDARTASAACPWVVSAAL